MISSLFCIFIDSQNKIHEKHLHIILFLSVYIDNILCRFRRTGCIWLYLERQFGPSGARVQLDWHCLKPGRVLVERLSDDNTQGPSRSILIFHYYWYDVHQFWVGSNGYIAFQSCQLSVPFPFHSEYISNHRITLVCNGGGFKFWRAGKSGTMLLLEQSLTMIHLLFPGWNVPFWDQNAPSYQGSNSFQLILSTIDSSITFNINNRQEFMAVEILRIYLWELKTSMEELVLQSMINPAGGGAGCSLRLMQWNLPIHPTSTFQALDASTLYNDNPTNGILRSSAISHLIHGKWTAK